MMRRLLNNKMNNRGSALLTVILVVGFLTILATTLLYVSGMNFQIKQADYQNKKSFYAGEEALEQIRARLMEDASAAAVEAYNEVSKQYITLADKDARRFEYNRLFVEKLQERWDNDKLPPMSGDWRLLLKSYNTVSDADLQMDAAYDVDGNLMYTSSEVLAFDSVEGYIRIRGVRVIYIDPDLKRTTIISTDFDVCAPEIDWEAEVTETALPAGVTDGLEVAQKTVTDAAKCVKYANWTKE